MTTNETAFISRVIKTECEKGGLTPAQAYQVEQDMLFKWNKNTQLKTFMNDLKKEIKTRGKNN